MSVSAKTVLTVTAFSVRYGVLPQELLDAAGIDPVVAADPDERVPAARIIRLWGEAARRTGDSDFGLHLAEWLQPEEHYDVIGYVCRTSPTLGEAYRRVARYFALLHQQVTFSIQEEDHAVRVQHHVHDLSDAPPRHPVECVLATLILQGRRALGQPFAPLLVRFRHEAPASTAEHARIFGAPVRFGAPVSELVLPRALWDQPQREADARLCAVLERQAEAQLARLPAVGGLLSRVRGAIDALLASGGGEPSLEEVAARLRQSPRSLQRHLQQERTSFRAVLDDVRRDLALRHLAEQRLALSEIAFVLGFSEVSAFHRAFRRWTGKTPASWRRQ
jgi:AraC-like DNA-binding protein